MGANSLDNSEVRTKPKQSSILALGLPQIQNIPTGESKKNEIIQFPLDFIQNFIYCIFF